MPEGHTIKQLNSQLLRYACSLGCSREDAEDIVQEVQLKAWEKELFGTVGPGYLKTMVKNQMINWKNRPAHKVTSMDMLLIEAHVPDKEAEKSSVLEAVSFFVEQHRYGYIIRITEERGLTQVKEVAPYTNENAGKLYKRYETLINELKAYLNTGGMAFE